MTNISPNSNGKSFCNYCDYGPLGFNTCSPRVDSQEERIKQGHCGYANLEGIEITNKREAVTIIKTPHPDVIIPKEDIASLKVEILDSINNGLQKYEHPEPSVLSKLEELYD
jgi:hypothetical protein